MRTFSSTYIRKIATLGMLTALAMVLGFVETLIPINLGIPGMKLGLANLIVIIAFYLFDFSKTNQRLFNGGNKYHRWYNAQCGTDNLCGICGKNKRSIHIPACTDDCRSGQRNAYRNSGITCYSESKTLYTQVNYNK